MQIREYLKLFKIRSLIFLILSATFWQFGSSLTHMLLITMVGIANPGKVFALSKASLTFTLPVIIFSPLIGILVDRWSRRIVLFQANFTKAFILILTPIMISLTHSYVWFWFAMYLFFTIDIFNNTGKPALLPMTVAKRKLFIANSLDQLLSRIAMVAGMVLGGIIIVKIGWYNGFALNSVIHIFAAVCMLSVAKKYDTHPRQQEHREMTIRQSFEILFYDLKEIVTLIGKDRIVALILISFAMIALFSSAAFTILVYMVQQVLKMGTAGVGFMRGLLAVGMIIGALSLGLFHIKIRKINIVVIGFLAYGLLFTIGPFMIYKATMVAIAMLGGLLYSVILVAQNTILQEQVSSHIRGRVFAVKELLFNITFIITAIAIGIISDLTSFKIVLFSVGLILLAFAIVTFILTRNSQVKSR